MYNQKFRGTQHSIRWKTLTKFIITIIIEIDGNTRIIAFLTHSKRTRFLPFLERTQTTRFYTILTAHRYSTRFSRLHRSRHEREKRKKRVEKYGGFSNVWGKDGSRAVITIRTADSARFFNGCLAFRTRQRNIVSVTHPPSRTVISRRAKKVDGTPLSTPPSLLYCRVSRGIRRHSSPSLSLFSSRKNVHKEVVGGLFNTKFALR